MNKTEIVNNVVGSAGLTKVDAEKVVKSLIASITKSLANNENVTPYWIRLFFRDHTGSSYRQESPDRKKNSDC